MTVLAIDPSLNSSGVAYRDKSGAIYARCVNNPMNLRGIERIDYVSNLILNMVDAENPTLAVIEGYALAFNKRRSNTIFDLAELGGAIKLGLYRRRIRIMIVPPTSLKLFVTGSGRADKDMMARALLTDYGCRFSTSDQYDAAGLLIMGEANESRRLLPRDARHAKRRALQGCSFGSTVAA